MMQNLRRKLKSNSGVTLVFALAIFLLVTLISMTIVTVALGNASRIARERDQQQENLALSSAASYLKPFFDGVHAECLQKNDGSAPEWTVDFGTGPLSAAGNDGLKRDVTALLKGETTSVTWEITPQNGTTEATEALSVRVEARINATNKDLLLTLQKAGGGSLTFRYQVTIESEPVFEEVESDDEETEIVQTGTLTGYDWLYTSRLM